MGRSVVEMSVRRAKQFLTNPVSAAFEKFGEFSHRSLRPTALPRTSSLDAHEEPESPGLSPGSYAHEAQLS